jgi:molybdopterin-guanine dinucleotide biosynthesis protein A
MISRENNPTLFGLVLAGGKSNRMGIDKGRMDWHGQEQRYYLAEFLKEFCDSVYVSCRKEQSEEIKTNGFNIIEDAFEGLGPYGAILSAFKFNSNVAWLVVACDLPLLNASMIMQLISERDPQKVATTFRSPFDNLPEPLITIWEPRSNEILLSRMEEGKSCPRKSLMNTDTKIIEPVDKEALFNANTPEDVEKVKTILNNGNERRMAAI